MFSSLGLGAVSRNRGGGIPPVGVHLGDVVGRLLLVHVRLHDPPNMMLRSSHELRDFRSHLGDAGKENFQNVSVYLVSSACFEELIGKDCFGWHLDHHSSFYGYRPLRSLAAHPPLYPTSSNALYRSSIWLFFPLVLLVQGCFLLASH